MTGAHPDDAKPFKYDEVKLKERVFLLDYKDVVDMIKEYCIGCCLQYDDEGNISQIMYSCPICSICQIAIDFELV